MAAARSDPQASTNTGYGFCFDPPAGGNQSLKQKVE